MILDFILLLQQFFVCKKGLSNKGCFCFLSQYTLHKNEVA